MVKIREDHPKTKDGNIDLKFWLNKTSKSINQKSFTMLQNACQFLNNYGFQPKPCHTLSSPMRIGMEMVEILITLQLDQHSLVAALLYRLVQENHLSIDQINQNFDGEITKLLEGVLGMSAINLASNEHNSPENSINNTQNLEKIRKMLVSIIDDVRVALIKIAEQVCIIRLTKNTEEPNKQKIAQEAISIYAPLAHRLGIGYIKWELEDLAFSYLNPKAYKSIAKLLNAKRIDREKDLNSKINHLKNELKKNNITAEVQGRVKHIYSIWKKMHHKDIGFHQLYDLHAIRILVTNIQDCYAALGVVHSIWNHIPKEFDDYITTPKSNGYQSLHTAVLSSSNKTLEVQIRTYEMHNEAELGVCSHWTYKGIDNTKKTDSYEQKLKWLRQLMEWHEEIDQDSFNNPWLGDLQQDKIYVFTRDGQVIDLPAKATPVDFAYRIHTEIGNTCCGAKVFNRIVPLNYTLETGDQVIILTSQKSKPRRDWLNPEMGYITTTRARAKIVSWFRQKNRDLHIITGQQLLNNEFKSSTIDYSLLAKTLHFSSKNDLFAACGAGNIRLSYIIKCVKKQKEQLIQNDRKKHIIITRENTDNFPIENIKNVLTNTAKCCLPITENEIVGYVTLNHGITIHKANCINLLNLKKIEPQRIIETKWMRNSLIYPINIKIKAFDRPNLIKDISTIISKEKINMMDFKTHIITKNNIAILFLKLEIKHIQDLSAILLEIINLPNVLSATKIR